MNAYRSFLIVLLIGALLSGCSLFASRAPVATHTPSPVPPTSTPLPPTPTPIPPTPTPYYVADVASAGEGGKDTRVLIKLDEEGNPIASSESAGYSWGFIITGLSFNFSGTMQATYWLEGAEQVYMGKIDMGDMIIDSDPTYPLTFKLTKDQGLLYMCGRGSVTKDGTVTQFGADDYVAQWLPRIYMEDVIVREAAAQALGWLALTDAQKGQVAPVLLVALSDLRWEVRRNAAEALGRIKAQGAVEVLLGRSLIKGCCRSLWADHRHPDHTRSRVDLFPNRRRNPRSLPNT
jgi:hypothetical protein